MRELTYAEIEAYMEAFFTKFDWLRSNTYVKN